MEKMTITLDTRSIDIILTGLGKLPLEISGNVYHDIRKQCDAQIAQSTKDGKTEA